MAIEESFPTVPNRACFHRFWRLCQGASNAVLPSNFAKHNALVFSRLLQLRSFSEGFLDKDMIIGVLGTITQSGSLATIFSSALCFLKFGMSRDQKVRC